MCKTINDFVNSTSLERNNLDLDKMSQQKKLYYIFANKDLHVLNNRMHVGGT